MAYSKLERFGIDMVGFVDALLVIVLLLLISIAVQGVYFIKLKRDVSFYWAESSKLNDGNRNLCDEIKKLEKRIEAVNEIANELTLRPDRPEDDVVKYIPQIILDKHKNRYIIAKRDISASSLGFSYWSFSYTYAILDWQTRDEVCYADIEVVVEMKNNSWMEPKMEIVNLVTYESYRRRRIASRVLDFIKENAERLNYVEIFGIVRPGNGITFKDLKEFYEQNGFKVEGESFWLKIYSVDSKH